MKNGIIITKEEKLRGVYAVERGKNVEIDKDFSDLKSLQELKKSVIGLPFEDFIIKTVKLPAIPKNELDKTIDLQVKFNLGENAYDDFNINTTVKERNHGLLLFIVASPKSDLIKKARGHILVPSALGIYAYAYKQKMLKEDKNIMLIFIGTTMGYLMVIQEMEIVFIRGFSLDSDLEAEISLSKQAVYFQSERSFVDIDEFIFMAYDDTLKDKINLTGQVQWVDIARYKTQEGDGLFLALGMALFNHFSLHKILGSWNVGKKALTAQQSLKRSLIWVAPILILFLPMYYYADYYSDQQKISDIQSQINMMSGQTKDYDKLDLEMARYERLIKEFAGPCFEYAKLYELISVLNDNREQNLWYTNISGKVDGEITVNGYSHDFSAISSLIKKLNKVDFIRTLNLNYSNESSVGKVSFQLTIRVIREFNYILEEYKKLNKKQNSDRTKTVLSKNISKGN